jgi:hypothetical protein
MQSRHNELENQLLVDFISVGQQSAKLACPLSKPDILLHS